MMLFFALSFFVKKCGVDVKRSEILKYLDVYLVARAMLNRD